jgi:hypothetical protein
MGFESQLIPSLAEALHRIRLLMSAKEKCALALLRSIVAMTMAMVACIVHQGGKCLWQIGKKKYYGTLLQLP